MKKYHRILAISVAVAFAAVSGVARAQVTLMPREAFLPEPSVSPIALFEGPRERQRAFRRKGDRE